jgi:NACHT domain
VTRMISLKGQPNSVRSRSLGRVGRSPLPGRLGFRFRRWRSRLFRPVSRTVRSRRGRRGYLRGIDKTHRWRSRNGLMRVLQLVSYVGGAVLLAWVVWAAVIVVTDNTHHGPIDVEQVCKDTNFSCGALAGTLGPVFSLALASALFFMVRPGMVCRPHVQRARERPREVVPTAGSIIGDVVGRDELCNVILADLRDPKTRRPHVVIGSVGTGKTALLVRLTQLLAERHVIPVAVRLRDAQEGLDFGELARKRFVADADRALRSDSEGERVWRQLVKDDRIVVLADGLEEALLEGSANSDRDNLIRLALRRAWRDRLPLVVASRPHDPVRGMEAAIVELEPLTEEAALEYIRRQEPDEDLHSVDWVIETADIAEAPFYLQITRQLHQARLLERSLPKRSDRQLDTRSVDRAELRFRLLRTWENALVEGHFAPGVPLSRLDREATVEQLSVLACIGLQHDRLQVKLGDFDELAERSRSGRRPVPVIDAMQQTLARIGRPVDMRLAATWGMDLGLVEARGDSVRFPHSIMQSYLAARLIDAAMADPLYRAEALRQPGRELLIALVMRSRAEVARAGPPRVAPMRVRPAGWRSCERRLPAVLVEAAGPRRDVKALDLYAAALIVDCVDKRPTHSSIADKLENHWASVAARDTRTLEEAKLNLVHRFGEAARIIAERRHKQADLRARPAYRQLFRIACCEPLYSVRLAAAQEIGAGGDEAFMTLADVLVPPAVGERPRILTRRNRRQPPEELIPGGPVGHHEQEERQHRETVARAWLAPMLVGSVTDCGGPAKENLGRWLAFVQAQERQQWGPGMGLSVEVGLALGFKQAANRRARHPYAQEEARAHLVERAREMLRASEFWFTRLILIQALCIWSLPDQPGRHNRQPGRDIDYTSLVRHWGGRPLDGPEHPFVAEARQLAAWALETGQPERFLWIDESGIVSKIGSRPAHPASRPKHNLWIPPSAGWTALHPRAQQLVADVLLLLNLAERGSPNERERRLQRTNWDFLPPCLVGDRSPLNPTRAIGTAVSAEPGSHCTADCHFELCPYPPKGAQRYRNELSEAFCRRQQALLGRLATRPRAAPWQRVPSTDLKRFWRQMGQPAQPSEMDHQDGERRRRSPRRTSSSNQ